MSIVNYGIIGCGMMGREHLRNIALLPDTRVAAIFEPDPEQAELALAIAPAAQLVGSLQELLAIDDLDCLVVVSPNHTHIEQFEEIAATRPLPLLIEKPLFTSVEQGGRLAKLKGDLSRSGLGGDGIPLHAAGPEISGTGRHCDGRCDDADDPRTPFSVFAESRRLEPL